MAIKLKINYIKNYVELIYLVKVHEEEQLKALWEIR